MRPAVWWVMRRFVPLALALACLSGCFDSHGRGSDAGIDPTDVPVGPDIGPIGWDAHIEPDAGDPPRCPVADVSAACLRTGNGAIPPDRAFDLPVYLAAFDGCFCGEEIECEVAVSGNVIDLGTTICSEILCDACMPSVEGTCSLPPLARGTYRVRMNGNDAFDVEVSDVSPFIPVDTCFATPGPWGCGPSFTPQPIAVDLACVSDRGSAGEPIAVQISNPCGGCAATPGPCQVVVNGNDITAYPHELPTSCFIACDDICVRVESNCFIPPLADGEYTFRVEGLGSSAPLEIRSGRATTRACVGRRD